MAITKDDPGATPAASYKLTTTADAYGPYDPPARPYRDAAGDGAPGFAADVIASFKRTGTTGWIVVGLALAGVLLVGWKVA